MPARSGPTANVLAGAFLLSGVVLAIVVSFVLSNLGERFRASSRYTVVFPVADGAPGIKKGSDVLLGGQAIGKVSAVPLEPQGGVITEIPVVVRIPADLRVFENAQVFLERPLLGSLSTINIASLGGAPAPAVQPGGVIRAGIAPPSLLRQAGFGSDQVNQVQTIISSAERAVAKVNELIERNGPLIDRTVDDASALMGEVRAHVPEWTASIDRTVANVESASGRAAPIVETAGARLEELRQIIADARAIVEENRPRVAQLMIDAQQAAEKINRESVDRLNAAIDDAREALDAFTRAAANADALLREETPNIQKALANARLASDQLKLAAVEVRSQPWRIFYRPTLKETETSVLYDSARAYASAVSDLRAASEALESALAADGGPAASTEDRRTLQTLTEHLRATFEKYRTAERNLLDRLIERAGESAVPPAGSSRGSPATGPE